MGRDLSRPMRPIWKRQDDFGRWVFGLAPDDFREVVDRVACPHCLERWPLEMVVCPVCRRSPDEHGSVVETPAEWTTALKDRERVDNERVEEHERRQWAVRNGLPVPRR